ncbi:MAG: FG-GAP-like repeat-containing protein [Gammaproteobacteria bacterium]|nr:FG-GAP-like repeat-containing protein [Gammaproteobacteria bacterium]
MHNKLLKTTAILGVSLLFGCAPLRQVSKPEEVIDSEQIRALEDVQRLMTERRYNTALDLLTSMERSQSAPPDLYYLMGESFYQTHQFDQAIAAFSLALANDPTHHASRQRRWAAMLAGNLGNKPMTEKVISEIAQFLKEYGHEANALFAAYRGYEYTRRPEERRKVLQRLLELDLNQELANWVATLLFEEILSERDNETRLVLMELYLKRFSNAASASTVAILLARHLDTQHTDDNDYLAAAEQYLKVYPDNRHLYQQFAHRLILRGAELDRSAKLLETHRQLFEQQNGQSTIANTSTSLVPNELQIELSDTEHLLGLLHYKQEQFTEAVPHLRNSRSIFENRNEATNLLGEIEFRNGDPKLAISYFEEALKIGDLPEAVDQLEQLLYSEHGYQGESWRFFANKAGTPQFTDVTTEAGFGRVRGQRVAWGDFDNDGFDDLLLDGPRLFQNTGAGEFRDVTEQLGLSHFENHTGGQWGDIDNDGDLDLFLTHRTTNRLLRNDSTEVFVDVTDGAFNVSPIGPTEAAAWGDANNDGLLDLYIANYQQPSIERAVCSPDQLFLNLGNATFNDASIEAGIQSDEPMCGRGVTWADINRDGWQDILVSNYRLDPNFMWRNEGNAQFIDIAAENGYRGKNVDGAYGHSIGSVVGDIDGNGTTDIFVSNLAHQRYIEFSDLSMLLVNEGPPHFTLDDKFLNSGIRFEESSSDPMLLDVDNDGDLDLFITSVYSGRESHLYLNDGDGAFEESSWLSGIRVTNGWGAANADYDNDGDVDIFVASQDGVRLFRNDGNDNHWLAIRIRDPRCNYFGVGNLVTVSYASRAQTKEVVAGRGTGSQDSLALTFGLGDYAGPVNISMQNLCGMEERYRVDGGDQFVTLPN